MPIKSPELDIIRATFTERCPMTMDELFDGFTDLKAVTWSSGIAFIESLVDRFEHISVIVGDDDDPRVAQRDLIEMANAELFITSYTAKHPRLADAVREGRVEIRFKRGVMTHEKTYLLTSAQGAHRTIVGSGNLSAAAFKGRQGEVFVCFDDDEAYADRLARFDELTTSSEVDVINHAVVVDVAEAGDDVYEKLPVIKTAQQVDLVMPAATEEPDLIAYVNDRAQLRASGREALSASDLKKLMPSPKRHRIAAKAVRSVIPALRRIGMTRRHIDPNYPKLIVDINDGTATLDGNELDLAPSTDAVERDVRTLVDYLNGFDDFYGDTQEQKSQYFKLLSYMFAAPFVAKTRLEAANHGYSPISVPYIGVVSGEPSAGKTKVVQFFQKAMLGTVPDSLIQGDGTPTTVIGYLKTAHGIAGLGDDFHDTRITKDLAAVVRAENQFLKDADDVHATFVITTNENRQLEPDIAKRALFIRPPARVTNRTTVQNERRVTTLREQMSTALFHRYLAKMLPRVHAMFDEMENPPSDEWTPDLYRLSSSVLADLIDADPAWCRTYAYDEFLGNVENERSARDQLVTAYTYNYQMFTVHRNRNVLEFCDPEMSGPQKKRIKAELPPQCEAKISGKKIIFDNLAATEEFLGVRFSTWHALRTRFGL